MKKFISDKMNIPKDVAFGDMIITIIGKGEVTVENYKGIIEYTKESIIIQGKHSTLYLTGKEFLIKYFTNDDMRIEGIIECIHYNS